MPGAGALYFEELFLIQLWHLPMQRLFLLSPVRFRSSSAGTREAAEQSYSALLIYAIHMPQLLALRRYPLEFRVYGSTTGKLMSLKASIVGAYMGLREWRSLIVLCNSNTCSVTGFRV